MTLQQHTVISAGLAGVGYALGAPSQAAIAFLAAGVLVDLDHLADYWRETGWNLDLGRFFRMFAQNEFERLWVFAHAWEWLVVGCIAAAWAGAPAWAWGALAGLGLGPDWRRC